MSTLLTETALYEFLEQFEESKISQSDRLPISTQCCAINYTDTYRKLMDCFRGVLARNEHSERTHLLTAQVIDANAANYTAWCFRRKTLKAGFGGGNLNEENVTRELEFTEEVGGENPKNYQVWFHRRAVILMLPTVDLISSAIIRTELQYISSVLSDDAKNYHAWSHRQWLVGDFWEAIDKSDGGDLIADEFKVVEGLLDDDWRNNSAWNHRWFLWNSIKKGGQEGEGDRLSVEAYYAMDIIKRDKHNESPFKYLRGILVKIWTGVVTGKEELGKEIADFISTLLVDTTMPPPPPFNETTSNTAAAPCAASGAGADFNVDADHTALHSIHALSLLVDFAEQEENLDKRGELCTTLTVVDGVRRKYWVWRSEQPIGADKKK